MSGVEALKVKIFADGADLDSIRNLQSNPLVKGFTTNPTLMRKAGVTDYEAFCRQVLSVIGDAPVSFEVFADDLPTMEAQARAIASWGGNVFVKIPVTNTKGESTASLVKTLSDAGIQVNVTALFTLDQVREINDALNPDVGANISVFAGRIADAGTDPLPIMAESVKIMASKPKAELIWASPREAYNIIQANDCGCHIITVTPELMTKTKTFGKDMLQFSLETVQMFYKDATAAQFEIKTD